MQKDLEALSLFELQEMYEHNVKKLQTSASYTFEQIGELKNYGVDVEALTAANLVKAAVQGVVEDFRSRFKEANLVAALKENAIMGGQAISEWMDSKLYVPFEKSTGEPFMHLHGQIGNTLVYLDPSIPYGSTHIYTWDGEKPLSVKFESREDVSQKDIKRVFIDLWVAESAAFSPCICNL